MINILKEEYWSKSEAFLLPLTGLSKSQKYSLKTYLFWEDYTIEDYNLVLLFDWKNYNEFVDYCKRIIFPVLDKGPYMVSSYDFSGKTVMVLDISQWASDIELFLKGKYSKMSKKAKSIITEFHTFYDKGPKLLIEVAASLDPNEKFKVLDNQTALEYVSENYGLDLKALKEVGEIGSIYNKEKETLIINQKLTEDGFYSGS